MKREAPLRWWSAVIMGEPASKANSRRIVLRGRRPASIKSAKALEYERAIQAQVRALPADQQLRGRLAMTATIYYASERPDLDASLILDGLQGLIYANDRQVRELHLIHAIDRAHPRAVIRIEEV